MATTLIATPEQPASLLDRARAIPGVKQLVLLVGLAAAIAGGLSLFMWAQKPADQPLFAGLPEAETAAMADALAAEGILHHIDPATGALTVPADQVRNARLKLAGRGLPKSAASGFESMQGDQGFGVSQSIESARMQHALETELVRTITSIQSVKNARVHLAVPKPSAFTRAGGTASASVFVELHPGRNLTAQQVQSIVHMVSSSVSDMQPSAVTVVDQTGRLLTDESADGSIGMGNSQYEQVKRIEDATRHRVEDILTPLMGAGRVKTQVVAALDFTVEEQVQEQYTPDANAIRSEQTSEDVNRNGALKAQGVPGATSNKPPEPGASAPAIAPGAATPAVAATPATPAATAELPSAQTKTSTRNYELNKTVSSRKVMPGRIERLSVAVLVDYLPKLDAKGVAVPTALGTDELARIEALVKEAMGFDAKRGDTVTVQNAPFIVAAEEVIAPLPLIERPEMQSLARQGLSALVLLVLILAVVRPLLKNLFAPPARTPALAANGFSALAAPQENEEEVQVALSAKRHAAIPALPEGPSPYEQKLTLARETVKQDPKKVAQVMKSWIAAEQ
ncbi:MAG: flagellar basal-body MS-ring/collar protein FliF [Stagnimonas sp.]|nr:flagellar basal-body MS-ring/collar protein FliF [Stagnimonas sp.]